MIDNNLKRKLRKRVDANKRPNKLAADQILAILQQFADGARARDLAAKYGVGETTIRWHVAKALA